MGHRQALTPPFQGLPGESPGPVSEGDPLLLGPLLAPPCVYCTQISYHHQADVSLGGINPVSQA